MGGAGANSNQNGFTLLVVPWWWHLLKDEGMLGAARVGEHQQIHAGEPMPAVCITSGGSFKHTPGFPPTHHVSSFHLPALSILCVSGTHNQACMEHLL